MSVLPENTESTERLWHDQIPSKNAVQATVEWACTVPLSYFNEQLGRRAFSRTVINFLSLLKSSIFKIPRKFQDPDPCFVRTHSFNRYLFNTMQQTLNTTPYTDPKTISTSERKNSLSRMEQMQRLILGHIHIHHSWASLLLKVTSVKR